MMNNTLKTLLAGLVLAAAATSGSAGAQSQALPGEVIVPVLKEEGVLQEIYYDTNSVIINGVRYQVAYDAKVEIRGSYGAFTMLQRGMKLLFEYRRDTPTDLVILDIEQLPDNTSLEEV